MLVLNTSDFGQPVPDVALQNGGGIRSDSIIPAGDISELDTFDMLPFSNFVTVLEEVARLGENVTADRLAYLDQLDYDGRFVVDVGAQQAETLTTRLSGLLDFFHRHCA